MKVRKNESFATGLSIVTFQFYFSFCQQLQFLSSSTSAMLQLCSLFHTCMSGNRDVDVQSANIRIFSARLSKQSGYKRLTTILLPLAHGSDDAGSWLQWRGTGAGCLCCSNERRFLTFMTSWFDYVHGVLAYIPTYSVSAAGG